MSNAGSIAVLLSAYNGEKYIRQQIDSILRQKDIESLTLYIRNDGSTDGTLEAIKDLQNSCRNEYNYDNRDIEIIDGENIGLVASFFELLHYAHERNHDFYSFSDQDDYWLPDKIDVAITTLEQNGSNVPMLYSACSTIVDENLEHSNGRTQIQLRDITFYNTAIQNFCPGHNQVMNKRLADIVVSKTKYSPQIYSHDSWITNVAVVRGKIIFDNNPHVLYRQHGNNQLSYGKNKIGWITDHFKRLLQKQEGRKIAIQLKYFIECYGHYLTEEQIEETRHFFDCQSSIFKRIKYVMTSRLYRQKKFETIICKIIYLLGFFKNV